MFQFQIAMKDSESDSVDNDNSKEDIGTRVSVSHSNERQWK